MRQRRAVLAAVLLTGVAVLLIGCASPGTLHVVSLSEDLVVRLSEQVRRQLGPIKVVAGDGTPSVHVTEAAKGVFGGMGRGAGIGAVAVTMGDPRGLILSPVGAIVGAAVGAIMADPSEKVEAEEQTLRTIVHETKISEALRDAVALVARSAAVPIAVADAGADKILEIKVRDFRFEGDWGINPDLAVQIRIESRLMDGAALGPTAHVVVWHGAAHERKTWLADEARVLREEIAHATDVLSHRIVEDLFLVVATPEAPR